jgi:hypothetical protein
LEDAERTAPDAVPGVPPGFDEEPSGAVLAFGRAGGEPMEAEWPSSEGEGSVRREAEEALESACAVGEVVESRPVGDA